MSQGPVLLFLCGGRRVALLQRFKAVLQPLNGRLLTTDTDPTSATAFFADRAFQVAPCTDLEQYCDDVARICDAEGVTAVLPLTCAAVATMPALAGRSAARLVCGDAEAVAIATDKRRTAAYFGRLGLPTPFVFDSPAPDDLPLFHRPRRDEGSRNACAVRTAEELVRLRGAPGGIFTRLLTGPEYSVDCYRSFDGRIRAAIPRRRLRIRAGEVEKAVTVRDETLIALATEAAARLHFAGPATVQAIRQDGQFYLTEINLRYGGGVTLSIAAGADSPAWLVAEITGAALGPPPPIHWGLAMSRYDQDIYFDIAEAAP